MSVVRSKGQRRERKKWGPMAVTTPRNQATPLAWAVVLLLAVLPVASATAAVGAASAGPAPEFRLPRLVAGGTIGLGDLKSHPAILLFWAPW
jgi:hypothetical protein